MSRFLWLGLAGGLWAFVAAAAEDSFPTPERIAELIDALDDPTFDARQNASEQLEAAGAAAIAPLAEVAAVGGREAATRALAILKTHYLGQDTELRTASHRAISQLVGNEDARTRQRAVDILLDPSRSIAGIGLLPPALGMPEIGAPKFGVFLGPAINRDFRRVTLSDIAGRKSVEVDDRQRQVKIEIQVAGTIAVEIVDRRNPHKPQVRRFVAKDAAELARIDPEMGRLYEQYLRGERRPGAGAALPARNGKAGQIAIETPNAARLQLRTVDALLKRFRERAETDLTARRMVQSLEAMRNELQASTR